MKRDSTPPGTQLVKKGLNSTRDSLLGNARVRARVRARVCARVRARVTQLHPGLTPGKKVPGFAGESPNHLLTTLNSTWDSTREKETQLHPGQTKKKQKMVQNKTNK